ncbi:hypothetical protein VTG60DRAFT_4283 [Thermothelomyces hinnuleus]
MHEVFRTYPPRLSETVSLARIASPCLSCIRSTDPYINHGRMPLETTSNGVINVQMIVKSPCLRGEIARKGSRRLRKKRRKEGATSPLRSQSRHIAVPSVDPASVHLSWVAGFSALVAPQTVCYESFGGLQIRGSGIVMVPGASEEGKSGDGRGGLALPKPDHLIAVQGNGLCHILLSLATQDPFGIPESINGDRRR